jgi:hypothetical protein
MSRETVRRKFLQKLIKTEYKKYPWHKAVKLTRVFRLGYLDDDGCNWTIGIQRALEWELAANFIRPYIVQLRSTYVLDEEI